MQDTIVVSGCPRSGTTLMMRILHHAGIPCFADATAVTPLNEDHPYGTYESLQAGPILTSSAPEFSAGKAIKIVAPTIKANWWPTDRPIKVVFMLRDPNEILSSMMTAGTMWDIDPVTMVEQARSVLELYSVPTYYVQYKILIKYPKSMIAGVQEFLGIPMDIDAALKAIDTGARDKLRKEKDIVTFRPPRVKMLKADSTGSIIGTKSTADDLTEEEKIRIAEYNATEIETIKAGKDAGPV